ncbi:MAG: hypothetical protein EPN91_10865 [Salinibacterium sp.]|nr:MAG: hypothetical protein EPN91_10865 [Salinibacterium sp.]
MKKAKRTRARLDPIDLMIRGAFPGKSNAGLRSRIRNAATPNAKRQISEHEAVRGIASSVALTGLGKAKLDAIADAVKDRDYLGRKR